MRKFQPSWKKEFPMAADNDIKKEVFCANLILIKKKNWWSLA